MTFITGAVVSRLFPQAAKRVSVSESP
jgi:hypothetical protein